MAANIFTNGAGGNTWGTSGNWSLGSIPTNGDGNIATFDATSPDCTINASARSCTGIDFTGYTGTITFSQTLTVGGSGCTLGSGMSFAGASALIGSVTSTWTANGKTCPQPLQMNGNSQTFTIVGVWTNSGLVTLGSGTVTTTINAGASGEIRCVAGLTHGGSTSNVVGTCPVRMTGTGTYTPCTSTGQYRTPLIFDAGAGTITISSANPFRYGSSTLTYTSGTMVVSGTTLTMANNGPTLDTSGMTWNDVNTSVGFTLTSNLNVAGIFTHTTNAINGAFTINTKGLNPNGNQTGTLSKINLTGGGTWVGTGFISANLDISGNTVISGAVAFRTGTLTWVSGSVTTTGSTLNLGASATLNTNGMRWGEINFNSTTGGTLTNNSTLFVDGLFSVGQAGNNFALNGSDIQAKAGFRFGGNTGSITPASTAKIILTGTGTVDIPSYSSGYSVQCAVEINAPGGTITVSGSNIPFNLGKLLYTAGTVITSLGTWASGGPRSFVFGT